MTTTHERLTKEQKEGILSCFRGENKRGDGVPALLVHPNGHLIGAEAELNQTGRWLAQALEEEEKSEAYRLQLVFNNGINSGTFMRLACSARAGVSHGTLARELSEAAKISSAGFRKAYNDRVTKEQDR